MAGPKRAPKSPESQPGFSLPCLHLSCCLLPTANRTKGQSETGSSGSPSRPNCPGIHAGHVCSVAQHHTARHSEENADLDFTLLPVTSSRERPPSFRRTEGVPHVRKPYFLPQHYHHCKLLSTLMAVFLQSAFHPNRPKYFIHRFGLPAPGELHGGGDMPDTDSPW